MSSQPIFLLSLPRAGSTLLQRLLSQHSQVHTAPEPWVAIPLFRALKPDGVRATYGHRVMAHAITEFTRSLPNKEHDYHQAAAEFLHKLYAAAAPDDVKYFLDKTPRYHLVVADLVKAFPDAKFIYLWRNPIAVAASMIETWGQGKWNLYMFWVDLYEGIESLVDSYRATSDRAIAVRYEDLADSPERELSRILNYLELDEDHTMVEAFSRAKPMIAPKRGDPSGQLKYKGISKGSMDSWKRVMGNPFRKHWSRSYLEWIGQQRLDTMGYDLHELIAEINEQPAGYSFLASDVVRAALGRLYCKYALEDMRSNTPWRDRIYFTRN